MMKDAGVFGMAMPRDWGGPELDPLTQIRVIEALSTANSAAGWCAMIGCDGGYGTALLDQDVARAMYPDIQVATGAATTPTGSATPVKGGFRVSGRFPFVSGVHHSEWIWVGCVVVEDGAPRVNERGLPETRQCFVRPSECEILDTWHTTGLRGTGSDDVVARDVFVAAERTFSYQDPFAIKRSGPLYALPRMYTLKATAPALGIARQAINLFIVEAKRKPARRHAVNGRLEAPKMLSEDVFVQEAIAQADALLTSARAYVFHVIGDFWATLIEGRRPSTEQQARLQALYPQAVGSCVEAVQLVYRAAGGAAIYQKGQLDRCLRDILTMNQHVLGSARRYEAAGRLLLDLDPLTTLS